MGFDTFACRTFNIPLTAEVQRRAVDLVGDPGLNKDHPFVVGFHISLEDARLLSLWSRLEFQIRDQLEARLRKGGWYVVHDAYGELMQIRLGLGTVRCRIGFRSMKEIDWCSNTMHCLLDEPMEFGVEWSASLLQRLSSSTTYISIVSYTVEDIRKEFKDMGLPLVEEQA